MIPVTPVPLRDTVCGLLAALSVIVTLALRLPAAVGVKVTLMLQEALTPKLAGQLLVWAKSPAFVPVTVILAMLSVTVPLLVSVTGCAELLVPTVWLPNVRLEG